MKGSTQQHILITCHRNRKIKTATGFQRKERLFQSMVVWKGSTGELDLSELHLGEQARFGEVRPKKKKKKRIRTSLIKLHLIHHCLQNSHFCARYQKCKDKALCVTVDQISSCRPEILQNIHCTINYAQPPPEEINGTGKFLMTIILK